MVIGFFRKKEEEKPVKQNTIATESFIEQEETPPVGNPTDLSLPEKKIPDTRTVQTNKQKRTLSNTVTYQEDKQAQPKKEQTPFLQSASTSKSQSQLLKSTVTARPQIKPLQSTEPAKPNKSVLTEQQEEVLENARKVFQNSHVTESKPDLERNITRDALEEANSDIPDVVQVDQTYIGEEEFYHPKKEEKSLPEHVDVEMEVVPSGPVRTEVHKALEDGPAQEQNFAISEKDILSDEEDASAAPIRLIDPLEEDLDESEIEAIRRAEEEEERELARLKLSEQSKSEGHQTSVTIVYSKDERVYEKIFYFPMAHVDFIDSYTLEVETIGYFTSKDIYGNLITINPSKLHTIEIKDSQNSLLD